MREVASFMQMYPAYKLRDVLNEYAISFFSLLNEGYRLRYRHYQMLAHFSLLSIMKDKSRRELLRQLEWAAKDPSDILKPSGDGDGIEKLKNILG